MIQLLSWSPQFIMRGLMIRTMLSPELASCRRSLSIMKSSALPFSPNMQISLPLQDSARTTQRGEPVEVLYRGEWVAYWDDSYRSMKGEDAGCYVFRPSLQWDSRYNIVHTGRDLGPEGATLVEKLICSKVNGMYQSTMGNEDEDKWTPFIIPWKEDDPLTPASMLLELGAHEEVQSRQTSYQIVFPSEEQEKEIAEISDDVADQQLQTICDEVGETELHCWDLFDCEIVPAQEIKKLFKVDADNSSEGPWCFYAGSEALNPLPIFVAGRLSSSAVGGFVSTVVHT